MNWLDITILTILGLATAVGLFRGLVREATSLFTVAIAVAIAAWFYPQGLRMVRLISAQYEVPPAVGFAVAFGVLYLVLAILAFLVRRLVVHPLRLGWLDALGGAVFGVTKGLVLVLAVVIVVVGAGRHQTIRGSFLLPYTIEGARLLVKIMPEELERRLDQKLNDLQRQGAPMGRSSGQRR